MTKARKLALIVLTTVLFGVGFFAATVIYAKTDSNVNAEDSKSVYCESAEENFKDFLAQDENGDSGSSIESSGEDEDLVRLTQRVTVYDENGILPYSGTLSKIQDAFYPGTYKIKFSNNAILSATATILVTMDVKPGDSVYVLTGNKEVGYKEYAEVTVTDAGSVEFETNILQNYTLSTTDISSAQAAMAEYVTE